MDQTSPSKEVGLKSGSCEAQLSVQELAFHLAAWERCEWDTQSVCRPVEVWYKLESELGRPASSWDRLGSEWDRLASESGRREYAWDRRASEWDRLESEWDRLEYA
ncbi:hypothetical protein GGI16_008802 [Coemansia sp. S142-1]|nr:hypothetical protein GGI16_008802 [Coemansia sp. S142-1]